MAIAKRYDVYVQEMNETFEGMMAFRRGEIPQPSWTLAKVEGWNTAGAHADVVAMLQEPAVPAGYPDYMRSDWIGA